MRGIFGVCLALVMIARLVVCLRGGRLSRSGEFPFLVNISNYNYTWCMGSIVSNVRIIFPDDCLRKSPLIGFASASVIPIVNQAPLKKYTGWFLQTDYSDTYTELDVISIRLDPPGLELAEWDDQNVNLPKRVVFSQRTPEISDVIVVGLNGRVGAMTILDDFECFNRIGNLYFPMNDRLQSTKVLLGNKLMCAVVKNTTRPVGDVPLGEACERDLGAPVIQNGAVVGMVVRSFCLQRFPRVVLISRLDHSRETVERAVRSHTTLEPNPSKNLERAVKVESSVNTSEPASIKVSHEEASTKPPLLNDEVSMRLRRQSFDVRNETESEMCHECEEPAIKDGASASYIEVSPDAPLTNDVSVRLRRQRLDKINDTAILETSTARSQCYESSCKAPALDSVDSVSKPRASRDANASNQSFGTELIEQNNSSDMKIRVGNDMNRVQLTDGMNNFEVGVGFYGVVSNRTVVTEKQKREGKEVFRPILDEDFNEKVVRDMNPPQRHRRQANSTKVANAANATIPGGNMTVNASSPMNMNHTENKNKTVAIVNSTAPVVVNVTGSVQNISDVMRNASMPVKPIVQLLAITGNNTVKGTLAPSTVIHGVHSGNKTGSTKVKEKHDKRRKGGIVVSGSGESNETQTIIMSGGDFEMGLERFGGSGNDTTGSGSVSVISGYGESAQDELHDSEEKLGPADKPKLDFKVMSRPPVMTTETPEPNTQVGEDDHVGPPDPNDDRPDYQAKPPKIQARHASFSFKIIPFSSGSLGTISLIVSLM